MIKYRLVKYLFVGMKRTMSVLDMDNSDEGFSDIENEINAFFEMATAAINEDVSQYRTSTPKPR